MTQFSKLPFEEFQHNGINNISEYLRTASDHNFTGETLKDAVSYTWY